MENDRKSSSLPNDIRLLLGSHQTDYSLRKRDDEDYTWLSYYNSWEYNGFVGNGKIQQGAPKSVDAADQTETASLDRRSASSRNTTFASEGDQSNGSGAVKGVGGQFDADPPPKFGPEDPNPQRNLRRTLSILSSGSNKGLSEKEPTRSTTGLSSDVDRSEKALDARAPANPWDQQKSREQNMAIWVVLTMIIATILSTAMAVSREMEEPMKKVDLFIFLGTTITGTLVVILVMLSRRPFEHLVGAVLTIVLIGIFFATLF